MASSSSISSAPSPSQLSSYTPDQISKYLDHIDLPSHLRNPSHPRNLELLTALHVHQISTFPYENLSLHYNPQHTNDLDPQALYTKFLSGAGRGGYCMEVCIFMREILLALGFRTFVAGAKIRLRDPNGVPQGDFVSWVHCVNVVTLADGSRYHVDVGFGGDGPTKPLPVGPETAVRNLGTQEVRIVKALLPGSSPLEKHYWWTYQYRNSAEKDWVMYYGFPELEFTQVDLVHQNHWLLDAKTSPQMRLVIMVKFLRGLDEEGRPVITGKRTMMDGVVKENLGGKTKVLKECKTEEERLELIEGLFGVKLTEEQKGAIKGTATELVSVEQIPVA